VSDNETLSNFLSVVRERAAQIEAEQAEHGSFRWTDAGLRALGERVFKGGSWPGLDFDTAIAACNLKTFGEWWGPRQ
jgi:hypothetical protein